MWFGFEGQLLTKENASKHRGQKGTFLRKAKSAFLPLCQTHRPRFHRKLSSREAPLSGLNEVGLYEA